MDKVTVEIPKGLVEWTKESVEAEIEWWKGYPDNPIAKIKIAEYEALLKNLEGK